MNKNALKAAQKKFLKQYPGGFNHEDMVEIGKKHKMNELEVFAKKSFSKKSFEDSDEIVENAIRLVSRSTMVSVFEKPKFRDFARKLKGQDKKEFVQSLYEILHGKQKSGFQTFVLLLKEHNMAKWPVVTCIPAYYRPQKEIFIKPTTVKLIINKIELDLIYKPAPTWEFYSKLRKYTKEMKEHSDKSLYPNNPAYFGFLMMSLQD